MVKNKRRLAAALREIAEQLETLCCLMNKSNDERSERWRNSKAGHLFNEHSQRLCDAASEISEVADYFDC